MDRGTKSVKVHFPVIHNGKIKFLSRKAGQSKFLINICQAKTVVVFIYLSKILKTIYKQSHTTRVGAEGKKLKVKSQSCKYTGVIAVSPPPPPILLNQSYSFVFLDLFSLTSAKRYTGRPMIYLATRRWMPCLHQDCHHAMCYGQS